MTKAIELIAAERQRQIEVEGFEVARDVDYYKHGELAVAGACYAIAAVNKIPDLKTLSVHLHEPNHGNDISYVDAWPWNKEWDKREKHDKLKCLVIAAALIAAQIDRELSN